MSGRAEQIAQRVRDVGQGTLTTMLGRGFDIIATYAFYAIISRSIPVGDFGRLVLGFTILQTVASAAKLGLDQALLVNAAHGAMNRYGAQVVLAVSITVTATTLIACRVVGYPLPVFALWLAAALPCVSLGQFIVGALRANGNVPVAAIADTVVQPAIASAGALVVAAYAPSAANFALAFAASWVITLLFALRVNWRGDGLDRQTAATFLGTGRSMVGVQTLHQLAASADLFLLSAFAASAEVGRYVVPLKIASAFLLIHGAITTASTPYMRNLTDDSHLLTDYYHTVTRWMLTMSLPLCVISIGSPRLILELFGNEYAHVSGQPLVVLSLAAIVFLISGPAGSTLLCTNHSRELLRITATGTISIIIAVARLARFGATGAAAGVLIGRLLGRSLLIIAMRRYARIKLTDTPLLLIAMGAFAGIVTTRLSTPMLGAMPAAATGSAIALALAFIVLARSGDLTILRREVSRT